MPDIETVRAWERRTLVDREGSRIGTIDAIYLDDQTGQPEWALVNTGLFGTNTTAPRGGARPAVVRWDGTPRGRRLMTP